MLKNLSITRLCCLFAAISAFADFRKAIEALQRNYGPSMLAEVKDAVGKKHVDGLMLFLYDLNLDARTFKSQFQ